MTRVGNAADAGFPKTTLVEDTVFRADGKPAAGWLVITWPAFVTKDGAAVAAGSKSVQLASDGSFSVALAPNAGGSPSGSYYSVTVKLEGQTTSKEAWLIPVASPATLAVVRTSIAPSNMAVQSLTTDWATSNLVSVSGAQSITGAKSFAVSPSVPEPVNNSDVASKKYVDQNAGGGPNVAKTNSQNTWTQPQVFAPVVSTDTKTYPVTAYGATSGGDASGAVNSIMHLVPSGNSGTLLLPPGVWGTTSTIDSSDTGFFVLSGQNDSYGQFGSVINCTVTGNAPCLTDSNHQSNPATISHSFHWNHFALLAPNTAGDAVFLNGTGNTQGGLDHLSVSGPGRYAFAGSGAAFHFKNSYTTRADHLWSSGGTYGAWLDNSNEVTIRDSQFSIASIANVGGNGVAHDINADFSVVRSPALGGVAGIYMQDGSQMNTFRGYFESGTSNYANHVLAKLTTLTLEQDLSRVWASDTANQVIDFGYNNNYPNGQGYSGLFHYAGLSYTNTFPNSSATGPVTGLGLTYSNFNPTQDCATNSTVSARGCSYKLVQSSAGNSFFGFGSYAFVAGHEYMLRGTVWADQAYYRDNAVVAGQVLLGLAPPSNAAYPSNITGNYVDTVPRQLCLLVNATQGGTGTAYFEAVNSTSPMTIWVTDITLADVTNIHGVNLCGMPYAQTIGATPASYSAAGPKMIVNNAVLGGTAYLSDDPSGAAGTLLIGSGAGAYDSTGQVGSAANPLNKVYSNSVATTGLSSLAGNSAFVATDFTSASTSLQPIAGLTFNLPPTAYAWKYHCALAYSQASGTAAVSFGIQSATVNPTNIFGTGMQQIAAGPPAANAQGVLSGLTSKAATVIVSGTPGATGTHYMVTLEGTIENPAAANTINFLVSTGNGANAVTVKRGSECQVW